MHKLKPYFLLLIVLVLAYLPLSSLHFAMKNDAFSDNFPDKYFLSSALYSGYIPLWNPYMNFGFPIYADPGFAFWNPITWLFAAIGYSAYTLTIEVLLYIYLAGVFMFRLARFLRLSSTVALLTGCMYMCSGFFIGSIQYINFLTAAAFLPLLLQSFLQLVFKPDLRNAALLALSFACVAAGGHPALPFCAVYMLAVLFACMIFFKVSAIKNSKKILLFLVLSAAFFLLIAAPALYSYASIWNVYGRNTPQQNFSITNTGFSISSIISFLFPFATTAHTSFFNNDVAMRNAYISIIGFTGIYFGLKYKSKLVYSFFITSVVMLILSFGGNFKEGFYRFLPLLKYVRTNGEYRVFSIIFLCLISGFGLAEISKHQKSLLQLKTAAKYFVFACLGMALCIFVFYRTEVQNLFEQMPASGFSSVIKKIFADINLPVALIISLLIAAVICLPLMLSKKISLNKIACLLIADLIINTILYLPVTGVGTVTLSQVQSIYNFNPHGIPIPPLIQVNKIDTLDAKTTGLTGDITYYNKKIGTAKLTDYPSYFSSTDSFFKSKDKDFVFNNAYVFLLSGNKHIDVQNFSPQHITINVSNLNADTLVLLQNYFKDWYAFDNGKPVTINKAFISFMSIPVINGTHKIEFIYKNNYLKYFVLISLLTLLFIAGLFIVKKKKSCFHNFCFA